MYRRYQVFSALLAASLLVLLGGTSLQTAAAQGTVADSVKMTLGIYTAQDYSYCHYGIYAMWPDVAGRVLDQETKYSTYRRVATEGEHVPFGYGEADEFPGGPVVPDGWFGHNPQLNAFAAHLGGGAIEGCGKGLAAVQARFSGAQGILNGAPFRVTDWYAVYNVPDGTVIAEFEWEQLRGLDVAFDGSFESDLSREVTKDGRKPVVSYAWDFGDGAAGSGSRPTHTYDEPGLYAVSLTVTDDDGNVDTVTYDVEVSGVVLRYRIVMEDPEVADEDTVYAVAEITNVGSETAAKVNVSRAFLIVPRFAPNPNRAFPRNAKSETPLQAWTDTTYTDVAPGTTLRIEQSYAISAPAHAQFDGVWKLDDVEWEMVMPGLSGEDAKGHPADVEDVCLDEGECDRVKIVAPKYTIDLVLRTHPAGQTKSAEVTSGLKYVPGASVLSFFSDQADVDRLTCVSGCVEIIATVTDENGDSVPDLRVQLFHKVLNEPNVVTQPPRGGALCSKRRTGHTEPGFTCSANIGGTNRIFVNTFDDGQARAILNLRGVTDDVSSYVRAEALYQLNPWTAVVADDEEVNLTIKPNVAFEAEVSLTGYDSAHIYRSLSMIDFGGTANKVGDFCEDNVKLLKGAGEDLDSFGKNTSYFLINVGTSWVCDAVLSKLSKVKMKDLNVFDWLLGENKIGAKGDYLKKFGGANLYLWMLGAFEVKNPHGLSAVSGPHPKPVVVQFDGEFYDWAAEALKSMAGTPPDNELGAPDWRHLEGTRLRLRLFEISTRDKTGGALSDGFLTIRGELSKQEGGSWTVVSEKNIEYLYVPDIFLNQPVSDWLATKLGIVDRDLLTGDLTVPVEDVLNKQFATTAPLEDPAPAFASGDLVQIGDGTHFEVNQVHAVSGGVLEMVRPLRHDYAAGTRVSFLAEGTSGIPHAPIPVLNLQDEATMEVAWTPHADGLADTYHVQLATDSLMADLVHEEAATTARETVFDLRTLDVGQTYHWRVRATNRLGTGPWTAVQSFTMNAATLPVEFVGFTARWNGDRVRLQWQTAQETGNAGFEVQRSTEAADAARAWTSIGFVEGRGTTAEPQAYAFEDAGVPFESSEVTYRLRQVDVDGAYDFSSEVVVRRAAPEAAVLHDAAPHPVRDRTTIRFELAEPADVCLDVYDLLGRRILTLVDGTRPAGRQEVTLNAARMTSGSYFVRLWANDRPVRTRRLVVVR